ncbi:DDB1- and CUL4-associated factor 17-like [Glandiceps talaboti]
MIGHRRRKNIIFDLLEKEIPSHGNLHRRNLKIMRKLVCQESSKYKMVWDKHSKYPVNFEDNKLYFDNYRSCYTCCGRNGVPQLLYKLPSCPPSEKIEDALMCSIQLDKLLPENRGWRPSFFALAADNRLVRYDLKTGELLQDVFLSRRYKFRHLSWETDPKTLILRSIHTKHTAMARAAGISQPLVMVLAVFSVFPLEFLAMLEIDKNIFGRDVVDAMIAHSTLVVTHQSGVVKLYSFQNILQEHTYLHARLGSPCDGMQGIVGRPPMGVPCNIKLTECPPALFEVRCHSLQIGGFPWHYIITPHKACDAGSFHIYCYDSQKQAIKGVLDYDFSSLEPDKCLFHPDDSGRILHIGANTLSVYGIKKHDDGKTEVYNCFEIDTSDKRKVTNNKTGLGGMMLTSSGRVIKKRFQDVGIDPEYESIQSVDYEDDMDLIGLTVVGSENFDDDHSKGFVSFYDNSTGIHLKDIPFQEPWNENYDHTVCIDIDVIVHIVKEPSRKFHCYVYRLDRELPDEEEIGKEKLNKKTRRKSSRRKTQVIIATNVDVAESNSGDADRDDGEINDGDNDDDNDKVEEEDQEEHERNASSNDDSRQ